MHTKELIDATEEALHHVAEPRFLQTERGFQGRFYCALQQVLEKKGLLENGCILEMEYQKSARHGMSQRPDIVLHVPAEELGAGVGENNFGVWALKRQASESKAREDFDNLDEMFETLRYPLGIFVNIGTRHNRADCYTGGFPERLRTVAVWQEETLHTNWGSPAKARRIGT